MRNILDFSSWQALLSTLLGLVLVSLIAVGIRLVVMQSIQQRRERQNRQINERLKTLISAYKTLGGSFTGDLAVDPRHLRELRARASAAEAALAQAEAVAGGPTESAVPAAAHEDAGSERRRRTRDAVEAALSDVILLGTREQVRMAVEAANDMVAGRPIHTAALVASLRTFIRDVLDLEVIPGDLAIPKQGPVRVAGSGGRSGGQAARGGAGGRGGGGGGGGQGGAGDGVGLGLHAGAARDDPPPGGH
jgi:uncharacterized membrane protein YgcG